MGKPIEVKAEPVYYHDCPALGKNARVVRSLRMDKDHTVVLFYSHVCPFCSYTTGEMELASGVSLNADGSFNVDMSVAEKVA